MDFDDRLIGRWVGDVPGRHVRTYDRPTEQNIKDCLGLILLLLLASIMYYLLSYSAHHSTYRRKRQARTTYSIRRRNLKNALRKQETEETRTERLHGKTKWNFKPTYELI